MTEAGQAVRGRVSPCLAREVVEHVLLGRDRDAVAGGGAKAPILQCFEYLAVNRRSQALNHNFLDDIALVRRS